MFIKVKSVALNKKILLSLYGIDLICPEGNQGVYSRLYTRGGRSELLDITQGELEDILRTNNMMATSPSHKLP